MSAEYAMDVSKSKFFMLIGSNNKEMTPTDKAKPSKAKPSKNASFVDK